MSFVSFTDHVVTLASNIFNVPACEVIKGRRSRPLVRARQAVMHTLFHIREMPYAAIGRRLGYDHTTVMHHVAKAETLAATDEDFGNRFRLLQNEARNIDNSRRRDTSRRYLANATELPERIMTDEVCALAGYGRATLRARILEGRMPGPIDRAGQKVFLRDEVLKALQIDRERERAEW